MDSQKIIEVKKSFACCTDLEVVMDHVGDLSSFQEPIVLLCLFLFHVDSPLEVCIQYLLESTRTFTSKSRNIRPHIEFDELKAFILLAESISLFRIIASVGKTGAGANQTSLLMFIFQMMNEFEFGNFKNSILSASFFLGSHCSVEYFASGLPSLPFPSPLPPSSRPSCCNRRGSPVAGNLCVV